MVADSAFAIWIGFLMAALAAASVMGVIIILLVIVLMLELISRVWKDT